MRQGAMFLDDVADQRPDTLSSLVVNERCGTSVTDSAINTVKGYLDIERELSKKRMKNWEEAKDGARAMKKLKYTST